MFADTDRRGALLNSLLSEVDLTNLPKWDEIQLSALRNELRENLTKLNGISKLCGAFESSKSEPGSFPTDDLVNNFLKWIGLNKGESVALAFALTFSSSKVLAFAARKALRAKLPEIAAPNHFNEIPDEIKQGLAHLIQKDEDFAALDVSGTFVAFYKELQSLSNPSFGGSLKPSLNIPDLTAFGKLGELGRPRVSLASVLEEYGSQCSLSADTFRKALLSSGIRLDEEQLANIMIMVVPKSYNPSDSMWNLEVVAEVLSQECRSLNWIAVAKCLDNPRFFIRAESDYQLLSRLFVRISGAPIPAAGLLASLWNNKPAQFAMLMLSANAPRAIVDFAPLVSQEQLLPSEINVPPNLSWLCIPLYLRLFELANSGLKMEVLEVIAKAAAMFPEYVLLSLSQVQDISGVRNELLQRMLPLFTGLSGSRSSSLIIMKRLYAMGNVDLLLRLCCVAFRRAKKVGEVLNLENIVKSLGPNFVRKMEEEGTVEELLSLWCIKADKGEVNLEEKLSLVLDQNPKNVRAVVAFIRQHAESLRPRFSQVTDGVLSFDSCATLIRLLHPVVPVDEVKALVAIFTQQQNLQQQQQQLHSSQMLPSSGLGGAASSVNLYGRDPVREIVEAPEVIRLPPGQESEDVEAIANAYFQKIYTTDISIPEVINLMRQFKTSAEKKEQEIFRCMVHNLYDEYRFFHKYPEKELNITGRLFGALIQHQLVSSITLGIALRYVLEALRKDPEQGEGNEKMFRFGQIALDQFRSRLGEWPQYCSHLIQIPHLSRHNADLFQEAQRALSNPNPVPQQPSSMQQTPISQSANQSSIHPSGASSSQFSTPSYDYGSGSIGGNFSSFQNPSVVPPSFPSIPQTNNTLGSGVQNYTPSGLGGSGSGMGSLPQQFSNLSFGTVGSEGASLLGGNAGVVSKPPSLPPPVGLGSVGLSASSLSAESTAALPSSQSILPIVPALPSSAKEPETAIVEESQHNEIDRMLVVNKPIQDANAPPDTVRDQVQFVINNVAKNNLEAKSNELKDLLKPEFFAWFATYLVEKRVSSQPNLHPLYLTMIDVLQQADLNKLILDSTYYNVTKYLSSPIITTSSNERSVLRNFGMWLGQLTLARNKPLFQKRIDLKELIFWGYETGRLIAVCSFIAKVLEGVKDSKVFRPPNPWLMAILGVLKELNEIEDLKLNIKFEVAALCKNINIKIDEVPKTNLLCKCRPPVKDHRNPDFNVKAQNGVSNSTTAPTAAPALQPSPVQTSIQASASTAAASAATPATSFPAASAEPAVTASAGIPADISQLIVVNSALQFFASNPAQRRLVIVAVERGIREIIGAAVDRAVSIATATTKQLVTKDFANEGNEAVVKNAAHIMVSSLASSLALAICKEPLRISISNHLRSLLAPAVSDQAVLEQIVQVCSNDNIDVGSSLIEKASIEKAVKDVDEALAAAYLSRKKAREAGQPFVDSSATQVSSKVPAELQELLRPNTAGLSPNQLQLYEAFQRLKVAIGTSAAAAAAPTAPADAKLSPAQGVTQGPVLSMAQALETYQVLYGRIDVALKMIQAQAQGREVTLSMLGSDHDIVSLLRDVLLVTQRIQAAVRNETAMTFSETLFHKMFDSISNPDPLRLEVSVSILEAVRDGCGGAKFFNPDVMSWLGKYSVLVNNDDISRKVYRHILILLLRAKLLRAQDIDRNLTIHMDGGRNVFWLELALSFIKQCIMENLCSVYDFTHSLDSISKIRSNNMILKKQLQKWLADINTLVATQQDQQSSTGTLGASSVATTATAASTAPVSSASASSSVDLNFKRQVAVLLERWLAVWNNANDQVFTHFLQLMHQVGVLKTEEAADRFFFVATDICVSACLKSAPTTGVVDTISPVQYFFVDALAHLFLRLIRLADKETSDINVRVNLLNRILGAVLRAFLDDLEQRKTSNQPFDQRPYYRLFSNLSQDLGTADPKIDSSPALVPMLSAYAQTYLAIQPTTVPAFAFSWLQLISKRWFMPHLLRNQKTWPVMHRLLSALLLFLQPFLKLGQLPEAVKKLYKGTLRVLLILLHDFPEFLCDYYLSFCDLIPMNCVQLRNLVLSAFPRTMRLPDPFTPNLKLDVLPEINITPRILTEYFAPIANIRNALDNYMGHRQPADLPNKLTQLLTPVSSGNNATVMSALVMYVASVWIVQIQGKHPLGATSAGLDIFKALVKGLDSEGRYILFNTMANHLRYPNAHTSLFSNVLLTLFGESDDEFVQEQITRVLMERLMVHRPHPVSVEFDGPLLHWHSYLFFALLVLVGTAHYLRGVDEESSLRTVEEVFHSS
eukprot:scaffold2470_cov158-Ochromonas_danica.AAC.4